MAEAEVLLGEPEVIRKLLACGQLHDAGAGESEERTGSARITSPRLAKLASTPAVVG